MSKSKIAEKGPGRYIRTPEIREKNRKASSEGITKWHKNNKHPLLGKSHSEIAKRKISQKMVEWHRNNKHPLLGKKHTEATKKKMSLSRSGNKNWNWQGGLSLSVRQFRKTKQYQQWRKDILQRDNNTCQKCNNKKDLEVHHILAVKTHPSLKLDGDNGQTLCKECHKKTDNYGYKKRVS